MCQDRKIISIILYGQYQNMLGKPCLLIEFSFVLSACIVNSDKYCSKMINLAAVCRQKIEEDTRYVGLNSCPVLTSCLSCLVQA